MKILYAEDEDFLREVVAETLREKCQCEVHTAATGEEAIELIRKHADFDLVISDYRMPEGSGGDVFNFLKANRPKTPFVLCSSTDPEDLPEFKGAEIAGFAAKPDILEPLVNLVERLMSPGHVVDSSHMRPFFPIGIETLARIRKLPCVLFVRLSETKYVKVMSAGDVFELRDVQRFRDEKKVDTLFIRADDCGTFVCALAKATMRIEDVAVADFDTPEGIQRLAHAVQDPSVSKDLSTIALMMRVDQALPNRPSQTTASLVALHEKVGEHIRRLGFTQEVQALVSASVSYLLHNLPKNEKLEELIGWFANKPDSFLSQHSIYLAHLSCAIATLMTWASDSTRHKLALAAFLHDISLHEQDSMMLIEADRLITLGREPAGLSRAQHEAFESHPAEAAHFLKGMDESLIHNVEEILVQHHERPDGTGFPSRLHAAKISPLASVMIVAHDLVSFILSGAKEPALPAFLELKKDEYTSANFKRIAEALSGLHAQAPTA